MKAILLSAIAALLIGINTATAQNPIDTELFPPDFLMAQRESLGLNETQLQDLQSIVQDVQPKFQALKEQLENRATAFREILHQANPDSAQVEEKLRALLANENEMKLLQVRLMLSLRNKLTPEQVEKARQLRKQQPQSALKEGLQERLQKKFEKLKAALGERNLGGEPPEEIVKQVKEIQALVQNGQPFEAEHRLDQLLGQMEESGKKP